MAAISPLFFAIIAIAFSTAAQAQEAHASESVDRPKLETLPAQNLEGAEGLEVVVSRVTLPPDTMLHQHWHPGEEFAYVLNGTVTLYLEREKGQILSSGEAAVVPLKRVHYADAALPPRLALSPTCEFDRLAARARSTILAAGA